MRLLLDRGETYQRRAGYPAGTETVRMRKIPGVSRPSCHTAEHRILPGCSRPLFVVNNRWASPVEY